MSAQDICSLGGGSFFFYLNLTDLKEILGSLNVSHLSDMCV